MAIRDVLTDLLACGDAEVDPPVCRKFVSPGPNTSFDVCSTKMLEDGVTADGQLWVAHLSSQAGWPQATGEPTTCATAWGELVEIGIVRCQKSKIGDNARLPDPDVITEDSAQQEDDRLALRRAFMCCLGLEGKNIVVVGWDPIPPQGGCVGGKWQLLIRDSGCGCDAES